MGTKLRIHSLVVRRALVAFSWPLIWLLYLFRTVTWRDVEKRVSKNDLIASRELMYFELECNCYVQNMASKCQMVWTWQTIVGQKVKKWPKLMSNCVFKIKIFLGKGGLDPCLPRLSIWLICAPSSFTHSFRPDKIICCDVDTPILCQ